MNSNLQNSLKGIQVILGSGSIWRKMIFEKICSDFRIISPDIDEKDPNIRYKTSTKPENYETEKLVYNIASSKLDLIIQQIIQEFDNLETENENENRKYLIVCADQVVDFKGVVREKPINEEQCFEFLSSYHGEENPIRTYTGICVAYISLTKGQTPEIVLKNDVDIATVVYKDEGIPKEVIKKVIQEGDVMTCCGGFVLEDKSLNPYVKRIEGEISSIEGLPILVTTKLMEKVLKK
ncbi:bifunctional dttp/utp pyrophosphatase/methyltransferase protein-related [Anaeramoeba flamelloides]|uniref:Bifunctional dttp/utp pyrophosphatase/methyltransferase protein-related n=1 Tax=Anaeramoeba flamelloides TaxID=1746091 RepID=A0AAV7ZXX4_9EUKA|nr:bifunctional dttp/utp pyrophosphatase/methyltransferase protein-related [Anaeramoeba flamelloides]|eukprot:Anaeramoba_flamelloidesc39846_g2_i1.p1 GENE.c39846_g2_i1~~c39846_g2_i1.p1  ORF type:complete len:237 (-),score=60.61 c39846_g2_i1:53-763(-)